MNRNEYSGGIVTVWSNRSQSELISLVATEVGVSEEELGEKVLEVKKERYKNDLTYWQILDIAIQLKCHQQ